MNLTEEKKAPLRARDTSFKRNMLGMHIKGAAKVILPVCFLFIFSDNVEVSKPVSVDILICRTRYRKMK
jgi:hypothetical protein